MHTWGSALPLHPHLHCLLRAGGAEPDGRWRASRAHFLLWAPILRTVFRAKLLGALEKLLAQGRRALPPELDAGAARALLAATTAEPWHVRIEPPYAHGGGLVVYLARYLRGGPIKNHRLVDLSGGSLCFRYREHRPAGRPKWRTTTLPVDEFLVRLFEHVPPPGLHMVRGYGLYAGRERAQREACRAQLDPRSWRHSPPQPPPTAARQVCPRWGAPLLTIVSLPRATRRVHEKPTGPGPPPLGMFN